MLKPFLWQKEVFLFLLMSIHLLVSGQKYSTELKGNMKNSADTPLTSFSVIPYLEDSAITASFFFLPDHKPYPITIRSSGWFFSDKARSMGGLSTEYGIVKKSWRRSLAAGTVFRQQSTDYEKHKQGASHITLALSKQMGNFQIAGSVAGNFLYNNPGKNQAYFTNNYSLGYTSFNTYRQLIIYQDLSAYINTNATGDNDIRSTKETLLGTSITGAMYSIGINKFINALSTDVKIKTAVFMGEYKNVTNIPDHSKLKALVSSTQLSFRSVFKRTFNFNIGSTLSYFNGNTTQLNFHEIIINNFLDIYLKLSAKPALVISVCSFERLYTLKINLKF
jgi:hypothetical protein